MVAAQVLDEALTLAEAAAVAERLGHPLDRNNLVRYAKEGRLVARKSGGTWLTTRASVRDLIVSLEAEKRGRPRKLRLARGRIARHTRTPELVSALTDIQRLRAALRGRTLSAEKEARLWEALTTSAIFHTNHLEGNPLTFEEAKGVIDEYRQRTREERPSHYGRHSDRHQVNHVAHNPRQITKTIDKMVRRLVRRFKPDQIILFGSHARGTAGPDSDVDLLVVLPVSGSKRDKEIEMRLALHNIHVPKDIIVVTPDEVARRRNIPGTIVRPALLEGKVLYVRR